jgi:hypothetical protein
LHGLRAGKVCPSEEWAAGIRILTETGHITGPAHIHMIVRAPGYRAVATHIFDAASGYLDSDAANDLVLLASDRPREPTDPGRTA